MPMSVTSPRPIASRRKQEAGRHADALGQPRTHRQAHRADREEALKVGGRRRRATGRIPGQSVPIADTEDHPRHRDLVGDDHQVVVDERGGDQQGDEDRVVGRRWPGAAVWITHHGPAVP